MAEAGHLLLVLEDQAVDSVAAADRLVGLAEADTLLAAPAAAVAPQVVAAEDIAVAAVRTEAVTNRYFSPATYAVLRDGVFICPSDQALT
jgi:ferredoxin